LLIFLLLVLSHHVLKLELKHGWQRPNKIIINFKDVKFKPEYNIIPKVSKIVDNVSKIETEWILV
jgi:hypothetical protein